MKRRKCEKKRSGKKRKIKKNYLLIIKLSSKYKCVIIKAATESGKRIILYINNFKNYHFHKDNGVEKGSTEYKPIFGYQYKSDTLRKCYSDSCKKDGIEGDVKLFERFLYENNIHVGNWINLKTNLNFDFEKKEIFNFDWSEDLIDLLCEKDTIDLNTSLNLCSYHIFCNTGTQEEIEPYPNKNKTAFKDDDSYPMGCNVVSVFLRIDKVNYLNRRFPISNFYYFTTRKVEDIVSFNSYIKMEGKKIFSLDKMKMAESNCQIFSCRGEVDLIIKVLKFMLKVDFILGEDILVKGSILSLDYLVERLLFMKRADNDVKISWIFDWKNLRNSMVYFIDVYRYYCSAHKSGRYLNLEDIHYKCLHSKNEKSITLRNADITKLLIKKNTEKTIIRYAKEKTRVSMIIESQEKLLEMMMKIAVFTHNAYLPSGGFGSGGSMKIFKDYMMSKITKMRNSEYSSVKYYFYTSNEMKELESGLYKKEYGSGKMERIKSDLYFDVGLYDFISFYPNISIANEMCISNITMNEPQNGEKYRSIKVKNGKTAYIVKNKKNIFPEIFCSLIKKRNEVKNNMKSLKGNSVQYIILNVHQKVIKMLTNSFYGVCGSKLFKYSCLLFSDMICSFARLYRNQVKKKISENVKNVDIILTNTDCFFVKFRRTIFNSKDTKDKINDVRDIINSVFKDFPSLKVGVDGHYKKLFFKNANNYFSEDIDGKLHIKGETNQNELNAMYKRRVYELILKSNVSSKSKEKKKIKLCVDITLIFASFLRKLKRIEKNVNLDKYSLIRWNKVSKDDNSITYINDDRLKRIDYYKTSRQKHICHIRIEDGTNVIPRMFNPDEDKIFFKKYIKTARDNTVKLISNFLGSDYAEEFKKGLEEHFENSSIDNLVNKFLHLNSDCEEENNEDNLFSNNIFERNQIKNVRNVGDIEDLCRNYKNYPKKICDKCIGCETNNFIILSGHLDKIKCKNVECRIFVNKLLNK